MKIEAGTKLYTRDEKEVIVLRVGRKYFYLLGDIWKRPYEKENLKYTCEQYSQDSIQLYATLQEVKDIKERNDFWTKLDVCVRYSRNKERFTLGQLREVAKMLEL